MSGDLLVRNVRPMGGPTTDVLVAAGRIVKIEPAIVAADPSVGVVDGGDQLLLPGLVNAHAHIDKNLIGRPWARNLPRPTRLQDLTDNERRLRREMHHSARVQSAREVRASVAAGTTHIRTHVDVDTDAGLAHVEGVMATRDEFRNAVTMQIVAFPQSGMLVRPGTIELLEEAIRLGADCIGGLDPTAVDRDPARHLDVVFDLAVRHRVEVDIHLHEPSVMGAFAIELIAERTRALGLQGRVTISHAYCLGMIDDAYLARLIDVLLENRIAIMSLGSGTSVFPPLGRLHAAGVPLCTGTDGVRDTWGPYNTVDMLERVRTLGYRSGMRRDDEIEVLLEMATYGGAGVMGDRDYGLEVGRGADFIIVPGDVPAQAVIDRPARTHVVKAGRPVAAGGEML
jgi:cytosine/adenosine deaminase-related metal-dependent hydrolase